MGIHHYNEKSSKKEEMAEQKRRRSRKSVPPKVQEARDDRRRERNRAAAKRCRERRETKVKQLEDEKAGLIKENNGWKAKNNQLIDELRMLREAQDQESDKNDYIDTYRMDPSFDDVLQLDNDDLFKVLYLSSLLPYLLSSHQLCCVLRKLVSVTY